MRPPHPFPSRGPVRLGAKLRASRLAQSLTIEQVAGAAGLTKGFVSRLERDETSPSVTSLVAVCEVLSLPIGSLFDQPEAGVIGLDDAPLINMGGAGALERLLTPRSEPRVQLLRSRIEPGGSGGAELYTVNCDVEVVHLIAGRLDLTLGESVMHLRPGDTLTFNGRGPHTWANSSAEPADVLWALIPAAWSGSF